MMDDGITSKFSVCRPDDYVKYQLMSQLTYIEPRASSSYTSSTLHIWMVPFKRKRDEVEDSDDEEPSFGRQILPVADLPEDFNDEPSDGMQYLFTVRYDMLSLLWSVMLIVCHRRDARYLPQVTRVANPFEKEEPDTVQRDNRVIPTFITLPSEEWRVLLVTRFRNFRKVSSAAHTVFIDILITHCRM